jgi:alanine racemase
MAYIKINRDKFYHNLNQLTLKAGGVERLAVVLKDNAYGHGLEIVAKLSSEYGIQEAVVVSLDEANTIRKYFKHILLLNATPFEDNIFSFAITSLESLRGCNPKAKIELKVDTGMHRNGISMDKLTEAIDIIKSRKLNLIGVMTHFRSADVTSSELAWQIYNFKRVKESFVEFRDIRYHSHNSSALLRSSSFDEDIARVGISIYGYSELPPIYHTPTLLPIIELWAKRSSTRVVKKAQRVGYGGDFTAPRDMVVSTYDLGYGDGWMRGDSKSPYKTLDGLEILGRVSMDFISIASDRDEICIMNNAQSAAKQFGTISYEMTTLLSSELERVVV